MSAPPNLAATAPADSLARQAEAWFVRLGADDIDPTELADFNRWRRQSPAHQAAWDEVEALFAACLEPARAERATLPGRRRAGWVTSGRWVAAALMLAVVCGWGLTPSAKWPWGADMATATGERRVVTLADGSTIDLDANSAVDVTLDDTLRQVRLRHGQAFFQVARDPARPFVVHTADGQAKVLGTRFSVADQGGQTVVAVEEGLVEVSAGQAPPLRLTARQRSTLDGRAPSPAQAFDTTAEFAWRRGQIVFSQIPLTQLTERLERYWPGHILVLGSELSRRPVSGAFDVTRREDSLHALHSALQVRVVQITPYLTVLY